MKAFLAALAVTMFLGLGLAGCSETTNPADCKPNSNNPECQFG